MASDPLFLRSYRDFAAYNAWANRRLYAAAAELSDEQFRADRGAFFASVRGTLNHLLVADRIWMRRFTGEGETYPRLDVVLFVALPELAEAREAEDARIVLYIDGLTETDLLAGMRYGNMAGKRFVHPLATVLDHFFNHQTHHRGQAHGLISGFLGNDATPSLDLLLYQREVGLASPEPA
jgi:uncharacterized damage-inducible protein DinB